MKLLIICFIFFNSSILLLSAQDVTVRGKIIDAVTLEPIKNANIKTFNSKEHVWYNVTSDNCGNYFFDSLPIATYDFTCTKTNYIIQQITCVNLNAGINFTLDFFLNHTDTTKLRIKQFESYDFVDRTYKMKKVSVYIRKFKYRLLMDLKLNWYLRNDSVCYISSRQFAMNLLNDYQNHFIGYSQNKIIKLFGKPQKSNIYTLNYFVDPQNNDDCLTLYFDFDKTNHLKGISGVTAHGSSCPW